MSKIIEKVVVARLHTHINDNSLNAIRQSAYHRHYGTETALLYFMIKRYTNLHIYLYILYICDGHTWG